MLNLLQHRASKISLTLLLSISSCFAKDVFIQKSATVSIPVAEYSIIDFPFKIQEIQMNSFTYKKEKNKNIKQNTIEHKPVSTLQKFNAKKIQTKKKSRNPLGITRGINTLTLKPPKKGFTELVIWGNKEFPIILNINVVDKKDGDKYLKFIPLPKDDKKLKNFESLPHEKIIERITQSLYDVRLHPNPIGYEEVVRKEIYDVVVYDSYKQPAGLLRISLAREIIGNKYIGQVWNVDLIDDPDLTQKTYVKDFCDDTTLETIKQIKLPDNYNVTLYEQMFDTIGVYSVSIEKYQVSKFKGTRVMIVRVRDNIL